MDDETITTITNRRLEGDVESLMRVRHRLAQSPDAALPKVLAALLPRLLERLERNHVLLLLVSLGSSNSTTTTTLTTSQRILVEHAQTQLTGILTLALERIRGGRHSHTIPPVSPALWIRSLLSWLVTKDAAAYQSPVAVTFLLLMLQHSFPWYVETMDDDTTTTTPVDQQQPPEDILFLALPALSQCVQTLHGKILAAGATAATTTVPIIPNPNATSVPESLLLNYRTASWLCLDVLALSWGLPALLDWDRDHFDEYDWSTPCCSTALEAGLDHGPSRRHRRPARLFLHESSSFQLWLDLLLFWPPETTTTTTQQRQHRRHRRVVRTAAQERVENATGMTPEGLLRMNHRCQQRQKQQQWNTRYLRELKLACLHSVVVDPLRCLPDTVTTLEDLEHNHLPLLRSLILCIVTSSTGSMHGKVALEYVHKMGVRFAVPCSGRRGQLPSPNDPWAFGTTSLVLACSLLTLVLGDEEAGVVLENHANARQTMDAILGRPSPCSTNDDENTNAALKMLSRAPMPFGVAERTIDFILTRLLPASSAEEGKSSLVARNPVRATDGEKSDRWKTLFPVFVDLVEALSTAKGTIGSYWAIQCLDGIYSQFSVQALNNKSDSKGMGGIFEESGGWIQTFQTSCLEIASRVLSQIADVDAETMVTLGEIQQPANNQIQPGGVPGPFGRRRDLNVMLAQHRTSQKKRQLQVDCALRARKQAYRIVTELASSNIVTMDLSTSDGSRDAKSSPVLNMPMVLLKCATGEEEPSMDPYVAKALDAWLSVYKRSLVTVERSRLKTQVASLLPSLLCAVCSERSVARLAAAKWVVEFMVALDPAVTWHVCNFLADDVDSTISGVAKRALRSMNKTADTPMEEVSRSIQINFLDLTKAEDKAAIKLDLESRVQRTAASLGISIGASRVLLGGDKFDVDTTVESWTNDRSGTLELCGLTYRCQQNETLSDGSDDAGQPSVCCGICYDEIDEDVQHQMPCRHTFCLSCWHTYICCALDERPSAATTILSITCPEQDCSERVLQEDIQVVAPDRLEQWGDIELQSFIGCSKDYSSCPGPDCTIVAQLGLPKGKSMHFNPVAQCNHCSTSFCFSCGSSPHQPAKCDAFAEWNRIFGSSQFWVKKNAKPCPSCKAPIEKNQGCNHIRCSLCRHDFCWLCLGHLRTHMEPHICNRYEPHQSAEDDEERRALFFTDRFKAHDDAEVFARNEVKSFEEKMEKLSTETLWFASNDDLDSMLKAAKTLVRARNFLKNSYVAAWAMRKDLEHRDTFDSHQANLELFTEKLSQLLLTKVHQLYAEQGTRAILMHFRAMLFCTSSLEQYMGRIMSFIMSSTEEEKSSVAMNPLRATRRQTRTKRTQSMLLLLSLLPTCTAYIFAWHSLNSLPSGPLRKSSLFESRRLPVLSFASKNNPPIMRTMMKSHQFTISYSPNFNRHVVSRATKNGTTVQRAVVRSFEWLDEAQKAYPTATLDHMDIPLPPPFLQQQNDLPPPLQQQQHEEAVLLSRIVAGAGVNETSIYYIDRGDDSKDASSKRTMTNPNTGGSYLLKFLQKLYSALPTITPAEIHRGVMDKFPKLAFYDAALVHERLFFLLAPLPPDDVLAKLKAKSIVSNHKKMITKAQKDPWDGDNVTSCFDDFPLLFYKHGYGAGFTPSQLVQALQTLPQYWLPIYLGDASVASKRPQDILPYVFYHLSSHPEALSDTNSQLDPLLTAVLQADHASLAHAKSALGLTWDQCRLLLLALPTLRTCDIEPNWELHQRGPVRSELIEDSLIYLRLRLQLDPLQVFALVKTHTQLSHYRFLDRLKPTLDALQTELDLDSEELKQLILRMPSLLGMSTASLEAHIRFFTDEVGMTPEELKKSILKLPALLQYRLSNLEAKLSFFRDDLKISPQVAIVKMAARQPTLWGLSLEHNLRPTAASLGSFCNLSSSEVGEMVRRAPEILVLNWKSNLEPTLRFLTQRLDLNPSQLSGLVQASPRVLAESIHRSLEYKIALLEKHGSRDEDEAESVRDIILERPALLITAKSQLIQSLQKTKGGQLRKKTIVQISMNGTIISEFPSVKDAAKMAGTSASNMYKVLREGKVFREMKYVHGNRRTAVSQQGSKAGEKKEATAKRSKEIEDLALNAEETPCLSVYVSGRVYPPGGISQNRGLRRAGGMAVTIPSMPEGLSEAFFNFAFDECCKGQILASRNLENSGLLVLLGYAYLRPSRHRVSLYICLVTLRVLTQVYLLAGKAAAKSRGLERKGDKTPPPPPTHIHIMTDSNYVYELLSSATKLQEWGSKPTLAEFVYTGNGSAWAANPDIIYHVSRTYSRLVEPMGAISAALQANLTVSFGHIVEGTDQMAACTLRDNMGEWAKEAAEWQYKRTFVREQIL